MTPGHSQDAVLVFCKDMVKKYPRLKYFLGAYVEYFYCDFSAQKLCIENNRDKRFKLNIGSGPVSEGAGFTQVDYVSYPGVHVRADAHHLPFRDGSVDALMCEQLIEHVRDSQNVFDEFRRIIKPGGEIYITAPFMYPFHATPIDMKRWTEDGLAGDLEGFEIIESGVLAGPTAALIETLHTWLAVLLSFNSERVYQLTYLALLPFLKPFKLLDLFFMNKLKSAYRLAAIFYFYGKKLPVEKPES